MEIPPRGRHYADVWDEEDGAAPGTTPRVSVPNLRQLTGDTPTTANGSSRTSASTSLPPAWHIADMPDIATKEEMRGLGNISERLIAAIIPDGAAQMEERAKEVEGRYGQEWEERPGEGLAVRINARELEERVKKELRGVMLLGEHEEVSDLSLTRNCYAGGPCAALGLVLAGTRRGYRSLSLVTP